MKKSLQRQRAGLANCPLYTGGFLNSLQTALHATCAQTVKIDGPTNREENGKDVWGVNEAKLISVSFRECHDHLPLI
jgi:hypothetical protein